MRPHGFHAAIPLSPSLFHPRFRISRHSKSLLNTMSSLGPLNSILLLEPPSTLARFLVQFQVPAKSAPPETTPLLLSLSIRCLHESLKEHCWGVFNHAISQFTPLPNHFTR